MNSTSEVRASIQQKNVWVLLRTGYRVNYRQMYLLTNRDLFVLDDLVSVKKDLEQAVCESRRISSSA